MNLFPRRDDIEELKDNSTEIIYQITDWFIPETDKNNKKEEEETPEKYSIYIYGTNDKGITICTKVINFKPYFYVKVPKEWEDLNEKAFKNKVADFELKLRNDKYESSYKTNTYNRRIISPKYLSHFDKIEIVNKKDFWGFTNNKEFRFLKLHVTP